MAGMGGPLSCPYPEGFEVQLFYIICKSSVLCMPVPFVLVVNDEVGTWVGL